MYCAKCERLIKKLGMQEHVFLKGVAKPSEILRQGWMYLQVCMDAFCTTHTVPYSSLLFLRSAASKLQTASAYSMSRCVLCSPLVLLLRH